MTTPSNFFQSVLYSVGQISLGLFVHPYQTMQMLVEDRIFIWMSIMPTLLLAFTTIIWRFGLVPIAQISICEMVSCETFAFITFFTNWFTFFMIYWQILLFYLLLRFTSIFKST